MSEKKQMALMCMGTGHKEEDGTWTLALTIRGFPDREMVSKMGLELSPIIQGHLKSKFGGGYVNLYSADTDPNYGKKVTVN